MIAIFRRLPIRSLVILMLALCVSASRLAAAPIAQAAPAAAKGEVLDALRARIVSGELAKVHSLLVVQNGATVVEWYFAGADEIRGAPAGSVTFDAQTLHDVRSVTKSVVSLLFGIALHEGAVKSLDEPVLDFFPEYGDLRTPERMKIRLRDLLSMTSGLAWDEDTYSYADPRNSETAMDLASDRYRYALEQPIVSPPGERFSYSGGGVALLGAVIARATGTPLDTYAARKIFAPLGISKYQWLKDRGGAPIAASGLRMLPRDMVKIGQLMLDGGRWRGRQVVPADWVLAATTRHAQVQTDPRCGMAYGYFWWLSPGCFTDPPTPWFAAIGNGGQRIWVVPSRRLVVVATQGLYNDPKGTSRNTTEILKSVLAATSGR